jgi:DNA mismatch repair protein MutS
MQGKMDQYFTNNTGVIYEYSKIKAQNNAFLILFQIGEFYEIFGDDAILASNILSIRLTSRNTSGINVPMCGIPIKSLIQYAKFFVSANIPICIVSENLIDGVISRNVSQYITPGTAIEEEYDDIKQSKIFISSIKSDDIMIYDPIENTYEITNINIRNAISDEFIYDVVSDFNLDDVKIFHKYNTQDIHENDKILQKLLYQHLTYINFKFNVDNLLQTRQIERIKISKKTLKSLNIIDCKNSIYKIINQTSTTIGRNFLLQSIKQPIYDSDEIINRIDTVASLIDNQIITHCFNHISSSIYDVNRILARIKNGKHNQLDILKCSLSTKAFYDLSCELLISPKLFHKIGRSIKIDSKFIEQITYYLNISTIDVNNIDVKKIINLQNSQQLKILYDNENQLNNLISKIEKNLSQKFSTKIKIIDDKYHGKVFTIKRSDFTQIDDLIHLKDDGDKIYITTNDLTAIYKDILANKAKIEKIIEDIFIKLSSIILTKIDDIKDSGMAIARLDMLTSFAKVSIKYCYTKPIMANDKTISIEDGCHPLINNCIKNNTLMDENNLIHIITGANMSGKSSYMKQIGIITFLANIGCFIPTKYGNIMFIDALFTRVGSDDDIENGKSTFYIEMEDMATIINNATEKSLCLIDEICRGTSSEEGFVIAQRCIEYISKNIKCPTVCSTHYHRLSNISSDIKKIKLIKNTLLNMSFKDRIRIKNNKETRSEFIENIDKNQLSNVKNYHMESSLIGDNLQFHYKVKEGATHSSHAFHVAKMCNLPAEIYKN